MAEKVTYVVIAAREFERVEVDAGDPLEEEAAALKMVDDLDLFPPTEKELLVVKAQDVARFERQWRRR